MTLRYSQLLDNRPNMSIYDYQIHHILCGHTTGQHSGHRSDMRNPNQGILSSSRFAWETRSDTCQACQIGSSAVFPINSLKPGWSLEGNQTDTGGNYSGVLAEGKWVWNAVENFFGGLWKGGKRELMNSCGQTRVEGTPIDEGWETVERVVHDWELRGCT